MGQDGGMTTPVLAVAARWLARLTAETAESKTAAVGPGLTAFLVVAGLGVATFFLLRSMLAHVNKVPPTFDAPTEEDAESTETDSPDADPKG
jgi:hypothetical protein